MKVKEKNPGELNRVYKRAVLWLMGLAVLFCVGAGALVVLVDPFFHYHKPLDGFPYQVDNQLSQNPGMAKHMEYDSVMLGSSMTVNFNADWFKELMGLNLIKLSYNGAYPKDQDNIMRIVFENNPDVKKVFLGIDVISYMGGVEETKYPIPEYLYDKNIINDVFYVLNKEVLLSYVIRPIAAPEPTNLANVYATDWRMESDYDETKVLQGYTSPVQVEEEADVMQYIDAVKKNLEVNICPYIEEHPDTEFVIFFPPYSILFWDMVMKENHLDATIMEYRYITEKLNAYDNVEVYFFPDREEIVLNLNNYADYSHYHPDFNRFMTECFADGTCLVAKDGKDGEGKTIDEYLSHMLSVVEAFDFEALLSKK